MGRRWHGLAECRTPRVPEAAVRDGRRRRRMATGHEISIRSTAEARDPEKTLVRDSMSPEVIFCFEDQSPQEAERLMEDKQIRRLPVLTREKQLAGIVALGDP